MTCAIDFSDDQNFLSAPSGMYIERKLYRLMEKDLYMCMKKNVYICIGICVCIYTIYIHILYIYI